METPSPDEQPSIIEALRLEVERLRRELKDWQERAESRDIRLRVALQRQDQHR